MQFQHVKDITGTAIDPTYILYTDESGRVWMVPMGHPFWEIYLAWIAQGNEPLPAA